MNENNLELALFNENELQHIRGGFSATTTTHVVIQQGAYNCCNTTQPFKQDNPNDTIQPKEPTTPPLN